MLRVLLVFVAGFAVVALVSRRPGPRRALYALLAGMAVYAVLKLTGVIDAMAPDRMG
jgi:hypothetical protein